jgi:hypothetical protein
MVLDQKVILASNRSVGADPSKPLHGRFKNGKKCVYVFIMQGRQELDELDPGCRESRKWMEGSLPGRKMGL